MSQPSPSKKQKKGKGTRLKYLALPEWKTHEAIVLVRQRCQLRHREQALRLAFPQTLVQLYLSRDRAVRFVLNLNR